MRKQDVIDYPYGATPLDPDELAGLKFKHVSTRQELDHLEQANIESGLIWLKRKKNIDLLTEASIRELHKKLFGEVWQWAGTFRQTEKNIGIDPIRISIQLRLLLDNVRFWIAHKTFSPKEIAIRLHHRLVWIHLFPNGNGHHARILADGLLRHHFNQNEIDWSGGCSLQTMNERRKHYIASLREADKGNYQPLLELLS